MLLHCNLWPIQNFIPLYFSKYAKLLTYRAPQRLLSNIIKTDRHLLCTRYHVSNSIQILCIIWWDHSAFQCLTVISTIPVIKLHNTPKTSRMVGFFSEFYHQRFDCCKRFAHVMSLAHLCVGVRKPFLPVAQSVSQLLCEYKGLEFKSTRGQVQWRGNSCLWCFFQVLLVN